LGDSLLYLLGGLDQPNSGEIAVFGRRLSALSNRQRDQFRRREVGFVFQNFNLLGNLSAVDNVLVPFLPEGVSAAMRRQAEELLTQVGLGERLDHRPNQLSGGEQQRVAIARALLKRPILVLADEPTGELDSQSGAEIYRHLRELQDQHGSTVVIVTHDRSHILAEDNVLTIRDGQLECSR
jgi:putative ABC transport system ATP-binding protein